MDVRSVKNKRIIRVMPKNHIGIYAGTFDPVHSGHISFALQAVEQTGLDEVYFLPERKPSHKSEAEHYGHRVAMLRQAIRPYRKLGLAEVVEKQFSVTKTLPRLKRIFTGSSLTLLVGADVFVRLPDWQDVALLVQETGFVVAVRSRDELEAVLATIASLHIPAQSIYVLDSLRPEVSSTKMRYALSKNTHIDGLLTSVAQYAKREWLYASIRQSV